MSNQKKPIVVQGREISTQLSPEPNPLPQIVPNYNSIENHPMKGFVQQPMYRDGFWGVLFLGMIVSMIVTTSLYVPNLSLFAGGAEESEKYASAWFSIVIANCMVAGGLSILSLGWMFTYAEIFIQSCLVSSVVLNFAAFIFTAISGASIWFALLWAFMAFISMWYACIVWSRIPFATANLRTGVTAIRANLGVMNYAVFLMLLGVGWTLWWMVNFLAMSIHLAPAQDDDDEDKAFQQMSGGLVFFYLICFYWAHQVLANVVHATTAGVVGTWWFNPNEANVCCSGAVTSSFSRATTYSFGSICLGSLIVAVIQALRAMANAARQNDDGGGLMACIAECILSCIESIAAYFNKWAFVYVGLYGYSFADAGENVIALFTNRGISAIIVDDLVGTVLFFFSLGIGATTGLVGFLIKDIMPSTFEEPPAHYGYIIFGIGFLVGFMFSSILLNVVSSAVDTSIVCFAEAPADFQINHNELFTPMQREWNKFYPFIYNDPVDETGRGFGGGGHGGVGGGGMRV